MKQGKKSTKKTAKQAAVNPSVERLVLNRLHALDEAIELLYYGQIGITRDADRYLSQFGFSQAHHRVMFVLARHEGLSVGHLIRVLGISKQAAQRPLKQLLDAGLISATRDPAQHRTKILRLTDTGRGIEHQASSRKRSVIKSAIGDDVAAQGLWMKVMRAIADNA
jgi:DNA-binding MarR family transcriptional regulator